MAVGLRSLSSPHFKYFLPSAYQRKCNYCKSLENQKLNNASEDEKIRDISRLPNYLKRKMNIHSAMPEIRFDYQTTQAFQRRLYAKFGQSSGIDASICWPTKEELNKKITEEGIFEPPLEESLARIRNKRKEEAEGSAARVKKLETGVANLQKWMSELKQRRDKKEKEVNQAKLKKEKLIEEVRQYFGYRLDPKDPKFQEILERKEKEEKKAAKEAKKKEKFTKEMAKLAAMASQDSDSSTKPVKTNEKNKNTDTTGS